jgi:hypothetical protein
MQPLSPQMEKVREELRAATTRAKTLADSVEEEVWHQRPAPGRWSMAECVVHLTLTTRGYLPEIADTISRGRSNGLKISGGYRRDLLGLLLCWIIEPPARIRTKTNNFFVPQARDSKAAAMAQFFKYQVLLEAQIKEADGLPLNRLKISSPFNRRISYNLYSCFRMIVAHQRRHLWQAEQVRAALGHAPENS